MPASIFYKTDGKPHELVCRAVLTIGRDKSNDIVLPELTVSRNHAVIRRLAGGDYYLVDSGSANGSYVNQNRVVAPKLLNNGDTISIGKFEIVFKQTNKGENHIDSVSMLETIIQDAPVLKQITIMVADMRDFTSLSEQVPIHTLTRIMNGWFHQVNQIVTDADGLVDKFIGDCVFARWETDADQVDTIIKALKSAIEINNFTGKLNEQFRDQLPGNLRIGVGINTGTASVSGVGHDNTALGDAVNIAFRMESSTKALERDVVISEYSFKHLPEKFWAGKVQHITVKGKRDPVGILALKFDGAEKLLKRLISEK
ncbi:MAG: adenylate/guanylate cyclase domain-containing protein [Gammaproteobacteria bacterium]|nr:adenylate/guanylate cyclase domain-containing protein [Gammaproteobacteria bacterium]MDH5651575.1 adenylate/guanylate cyclase domain-containing protein [Gammaproteobacteria bacterium]